MRATYSGQDQNELLAFELGRGSDLSVHVHSEFSLLNPTNALEKVVAEFTRSIELLNQLGTECTDIRSYRLEHSRVKQLVDYVGDNLVSQQPDFSRISWLMESISDYYSPRELLYGAHLFPSTHVKRWKEFHQLLQDELARVSYTPAQTPAEAARRVHSQRLLTNLSYDPNDIAQPWKTKTAEKDLAHDWHEARTRSFFRQLQGVSKHALSCLPITNQGFDRDARQEWNNTFKETWNSALDFASYHIKNPLIQPITGLSQCAYFIHDWLRPECHPRLQGAIHSLLDHYLGLVQAHYLGDNVSHSLKDQFEDFGHRVFALKQNYSEHLFYRQVPFDQKAFESETSGLISEIETICTDLGRTYGRTSVLEYEFYAPKGINRLLLVPELAEIERSRLGPRHSNNLLVPYGVQGITNLLQRPDSQLFVLAHEQKSIGFAIVLTNTENLPIELNPLIEYAKRERGDVPRAYVPLVVVSQDAPAICKNAIGDSYQALIKAIDDFAFRLELGYYLGWCRDDNPALIKHLFSGAELLPGSFTVSENGVVMEARPLLRLVHPRGLQREMNYGRFQALQLRHQRDTITS